MNCLLFFLLLINCAYSFAFKIYSFYENLYDTRRPEYLVLQLLSKQPSDIDVNFLAAPWHTLYFNEITKRKPSLSDLKNLKFNGGFAVCSHDDYQTLIPLLKKIGIDTLFSSGSTPEKNKGFKVVTFPYSTMNNVLPADNKDIFYSFIGSATHILRNRIFQMNHANDTIIIRREKFHYNESNAKKKEHHEKQYADVLSRSRFSLCPRGVSPGSIRFWESLQAGAIPILISDDYQLPKGFNWNKCIIKVEEKDVENIPDILGKISIEQENILRRNCFIAHKRFSGTNFANVIKRYYRTTN